MYIYTAAAEAPNNVTGQAENSSTIIVQWNTTIIACRRTNGNITSYRIHYTAQHNGTLNISTTGKEIMMASLTGLTPYTNYFIKVAAVNEEGDVGVYSDNITVETPEDGKFNY